MSKIAKLSFAYQYQNGGRPMRKFVSGLTELKGDKTNTIMKKYTDSDFILGINNTNHFIHNIKPTLEKNVSLTLLHYVNDTKLKRKWSLDNPGFLLGTAYMYFVFGQERELLKNFRNW